MIFIFTHQLLSLSQSLYLSFRHFFSPPTIPPPPPLPALARSPTFNELEFHIKSEDEQFHSLDSETMRSETFHTVTTRKISESQSFRSFQTFQSKRTIQEDFEESVENVLNKYFALDNVKLGKITPLKNNLIENQIFNPGSFQIQNQNQYGFKIYLKTPFSSYPSLLTLLNSPLPMQSLWQSQIHRLLLDPLAFSEKLTLYFHNQQFKCTRTVILDNQGYQEVWKGDGIIRLVKITKGQELEVKVYQMV